MFEVQEQLYSFMIHLYVIRGQLCTIGILFYLYIDN